VPEQLDKRLAVLEERVGNLLRSVEDLHDEVSALRRILITSLAGMVGSVIVILIGLLVATH
jgi:chaperonin cofactor prefoldin